MTSPMPPRRRDSRGWADLVRQDRTRLGQLDRGLVGGRYPPARPLWAAGSGDIEEDDELDTEIAFENGDRTIADGPGTVTLRLRYEPLPGSLHIRWNGIDQPPTEWAADGRIVVIPDPFGQVRLGDLFTAAYAYEQPDEEELSVFFVGSTSVAGACSSIALPPATEPGDLLVFASASFYTADSSDPRLTGTIGTAYGTGARVMWGFATSSVAPIACSVVTGGDYAATTLAVYRGANSVAAFSAHDSATNDITMPTETDSIATVGALLAFDHTVAGFIEHDSTGAWTTDAWADHIKAHATVVSWSTADEAVTSPAGAFHMTGTWYGFLAATLKLSL